MPKGFFTPPRAVNETIKSYAPGSIEKKKLLAEYNKLFNKKVEVPMYIGSKKVKTNWRTTSGNWGNTYRCK